MVTKRRKQAAIGKPTSIDPDFPVPPPEERDPDQAWFWESEFLAGVREALAESKAGRSHVYMSTEEFIRALEELDEALGDGAKD